MPAMTRGVRLATTWLHAVCITLWVSLAFAPTAHAEGNDVDSLRQELGELKRAVEHLDSKLQRLEEQQSPSPLATSPADAGAATPAREPPAPVGAAGVQQRWREIKYGMTTDQITVLLGSPQRTMDLNPKTVWYYSYPEIGNGSVVFTTEGGVVDWQLPPFNVWW